MDLDNIKQVWKAQQTASFSKEQILEMRQKRSSSIAKWIFYISLAEFVFWIALAILLPDKSNNYLNEKTSLFFDVLTYINYFIVIGFIYVFFQSYIKIKSHQPPKQLLQNIFRMRKSVQYYIVYNLSVIVIFALLMILFLLVDERNVLNIPTDLQQSLIFWGVLLFMSLVFIVALFTAMYFFYRLLYGFLLKRLQKNYEEIKDLQ